MTTGFNRSRPLAAVIVGRAGMDLYPLPDGSETEGAAHFAAEIGGSAGNIAVALTRQGFPAALLSAFSDDAVGRFVRGHLMRFGVDVSRCRSIPGPFRTSLALCETRHPDSETVFYRSEAADLELAPNDFDAQFIASASILIVTGTSLAREPSRAAALQALDMARATETFSILDIDHRPVSWRSRDEAQRVYADAAGRADAVIGNDEEFAVIAGPHGEAFATAAGFVARGAAFAILKRGAFGSTTITNNGVIEKGVFDVKVMKPFGAGDAFLGNLATTLLEGATLEHAVERASAAAAYVVARRGCAFAMPDRAALDHFVQSHAMMREALHAHPPL